MRAPQPELAALAIADPPDRWRALGFTVDERDRVVIGGVALTLGGGGVGGGGGDGDGDGDGGGGGGGDGGGGAGITGWTLRHLPATGDIDGLATSVTAEPALPAPSHPNGAVAVDHVVIVTPDFDGTTAVLAARGLPLRRIRQAGDRRQGFRRLGPAIMEIVETPQAPATRFWGLVVIVADLHRLRADRAAHVGEVRPAVQPGRHIATLAPSAGLSVPVAFMDPE